jgi:hypothetical protein
METDLIENVDGNQLLKDKGQWRFLVNKVISCQLSLLTGNFLTS